MTRALGTCCWAPSMPDAVKEVLHIPADVKVVTMIPLGYHDGTQPRRDRKPVDEIVSYNAF